VSQTGDDLIFARGATTTITASGGGVLLFPG